MTTDCKNCLQTHSWPCFENISTMIDFFFGRQLYIVFRKDTILKDTRYSMYKWLYISCQPTCQMNILSTKPKYSPLLCPTFTTWNWKHLYVIKMLKLWLRKCSAHWCETKLVLMQPVAIRSHIISFNGVHISPITSVLWVILCRILTYNPSQIHFSSRL